MKMAEKLSQTQKDNQRVMPRRKQGKESSEEVGLCCPRPRRGQSLGRPRGLTSERSRMPEEAGKNLTHWVQERKGEKVGGTQQTLSICSRAGGGTERRWTIVYVSSAVSAGRTQENISEKKWGVIHPISPPSHKPDSSERTAQRAAERGRPKPALLQREEQHGILSKNDNSEWVHATAPDSDAQNRLCMDRHRHRRDPAFRTATYPPSKCVTYIREGFSTYILYSFINIYVPELA